MRARITLVGVALAATSVLSTTSPALAGGSTVVGGNDAFEQDRVALTLAIEHSESALTAADRAVLARHPELAAKVVDPEATQVVKVSKKVKLSQAQAKNGDSAEVTALLAEAETVTTVTNVNGVEEVIGGSGEVQAVAAGFYCQEATYSKRERSTLGLSTLYQLNHYFRWCYEHGGTVHEIVSRRHWMSNMDVIADYKSLISSWKDGLHTSRVRSFYQVHVQLCYPKVLCANRYPKVGINGYNNGTSNHWT